MDKICERRCFSSSYFEIFGKFLTFFSWTRRYESILSKKKCKICGHLVVFTLQASDLPFTKCNSAYWIKGAAESGVRQLKTRGGANTKKSSSVALCFFVKIFDLSWYFTLLIMKLIEFLQKLFINCQLNWDQKLERAILISPICQIFYKSK